MDGSQLGGRFDDATGGDGRTGRNLSVVVANEAGKLEQALPLVHDRSLLTVSSAEALMRESRVTLTFKLHDETICVNVTAIQTSTRTCSNHIK